MCFTGPQTNSGQVNVNNYNVIFEFLGSSLVPKPNRLFFFWGEDTDKFVLCLPLPAPPPCLTTQSSRQGSPCTPWGSGSAWGSRRSSWNSLSRAPSLKRRDPSGERESLLSGVGRRDADESDEDGEPGAGRGAVGGGPLLHPHPETLDLPELLHGPAGRSSVEMLDRNGRTLHPPHAALLRPPKENPDSEEDMDEVSGQSRYPRRPAQIHLRLVLPGHHAKIRAIIKLKQSPPPPKVRRARGPVRALMHPAFYLAGRKNGVQAVRKSPPWSLGTPEKLGISDS